MLSQDTQRLQAIPMLASVDIAKLKLIAMVGQRLEFQPGEVITRSGEPADAVFIVLDGEVDIARETEAVTVPIARRGPGYIVGDISVLLSEPYQATIAALVPVTVLRLEARTFLDLVTEVPQFAMALMRDLARRVITVAELYAGRVA